MLWPGEISLTEIVLMQDWTQFLHNLDYFCKKTRRHFLKLMYLFIFKSVEPPEQIPRVLFCFTGFFFLRTKEKIEKQFLSSFQWLWSSKEIHIDIVICFN